MSGSDGAPAEPDVTLWTALRPTINAPRDGDHGVPAVGCDLRYSERSGGEISPDGSTADVITVAGTDRLAFTNLAGASSSVVGSLVTGQLSSTPYVTLTDGDIVRVRASGPASALMDTCPLLDSPADLVFSESLRQP